MYSPQFLLFLVAVALCGCAKKNQNSTDSASTSLEAENKNTSIVLFGDSITAGFGLDSGDTFSHLLQVRVDSLGCPYSIVNAGVSGETSAGGKSRIDWVLSTPPDILFLQLGANDGLRGLPLGATYDNLQFIIDRVIERNSRTCIILAGMQIPPNMGIEYTESFRSIYANLAKQNDILLIPSFLEGVGGDPELNLDDMIHPNARGNKILADKIWDVLVPLLVNCERG